ncbi:nucleotidyltransferase family protein [Marinilabiliaceae bacterium N1Y90]|nr:nucleotidyltransferase family protein [Marinilabiliaceae bacterium N1Y90]
MKQQKMLLPFSGCSVIENVCKASIFSEVKLTIVVSGSNGTQIQQAIKDLPIQIVHNAEFEKGMLSSVQAGVEEAKEYDAFFILPGDQPFITSPIFDQLISTYQSSDKGLIVPTFKGKKGHPVLINSSYAEQIMHLDHNIGLRQLFHENQTDIQLLELDSDEILIDIDHPEDYTEALKRFNNET